MRTKKILILVAAILHLTSFAKADEFCNDDLLYSYGILNSGYNETKSLLCGNAKPETCCSEKAELLALRNWQEVNKVKVKQYMESYIYLTKAVLNFYEFFSERAKEVENFPGASDECKNAAEMFIVKFKTNQEVFQYVDDLEKIYTHLGFLRKSFYCALCSVENQQYFNIKNKILTYANTFCHNLVISTIQLFYERNEEFNNILNYMNILKDCDPNVPYTPDPYIINMRLDKTDEIALNKCYDTYVKDPDPRVFMDECVDYCKSYSITKATEMFEGSFGKVNYLYKKLTDNETKPQGTLIFDDIDYDVNPDFSMINGDFYQNNLKLINLHNFNIEFDRDGIELFFLGSVSTGFSLKESASLSKNLFGVLILAITILFK